MGLHAGALRAPGRARQDRRPPAKRSRCSTASPTLAAINAHLRHKSANLRSVGPDAGHRGRDQRRSLEEPRSRSRGARSASGEPCYVIAEAGVNHNCDVAARASALVETAAAAGADAIKFQSYTASQDRDPRGAALLGRARGPEGHAVGHLRQARQALRRATSARCSATRGTSGITAFSTPFDDEAVDFLASLDVPAFKIASADLTCHGAASSAPRAWASR